RGLVHGVVHDENAWRLDGVAGHAGVFSTADDVAEVVVFLSSPEARHVVLQEIYVDGGATLHA
ncbi:SDR family oxidoreductase, partial [Corynebacterium variabile]|uniref:SDR family oxidoreductase n=1 Tax=Corynebacterium variabile TaxID=1727 RepID=UPI002FE08C23